MLDNTDTRREKDLEKRYEGLEKKRRRKEEREKEEKEERKRRERGKDSWF